LGSFFALLLMAKHGQFRWGVPLGALFVGIAALGVMDLLGTFDDSDERVAHSTTLREVRAPLAAFVALVVLFLGALSFASAGVLFGQFSWGIIVTVAFIGAVAAMFDLGRRLGVYAHDETGAARPLWERHGFWVVALGAALLMPFMGSYSLWDPWETHYGEVAREMLARDDWISLWWAQDGWFWSKPVLDMWMQAIAMATLGIHYEPDKMLIGAGTQPIWHPEWAVRAPVVLLTILAAYLFYKGASKPIGRRAAFLGSLVLATMPDWYLIAHQTMTDMPCVAALTACMGLVLLGLHTPHAEPVRAYEVKVGSRRLRLTGWHLVFGAVLVCALPQILYLLSRNCELVWNSGGAHGFRWHWDEFRSGSGGGNCGLPGNEECRTTLPATIPHSTGANPDSFGPIVWRTIGAVEPGIQAVIWVALAAWLLAMNWGERRAQRLYYLGAWFFAAVATLGKGPEGVVLPVVATFGYLAFSHPREDFLARLKRLGQELSRFEIVGGLIVLLIVAIPWYVAMYVRHGPPFTDRLIFHDMFNRAFHHVHDTNEGDDTSIRFYLWQLGYALFPWTGLAPLGLMWWMRGSDAPDQRRRADTGILFFVWFLFAFALFTYMGTKFHHYILPAVPPLAMLIGMVLDDMLGDRPIPAGMRLLRYAVAMTAGVTLLALGVSWTQPGSFLGTKPDGSLPGPSMGLAIPAIVVGCGLVALAVWLVRGFGQAKATEIAAEQGHTSRVMSAASVAGALLLVLVGRDLVIKPENADQPGAIRLLHLFTYNYRRPWPDSLDFSAPLAAFTVVAIVALLALGVERARRHAVAGACALGVVWGLWGLDVYMVKTAPHWGQHEAIAAYYADRSSPDDLLVAYQMNWKGENFYTGNRIPAFVSTGATFTSWLKKKKEEGVKVMYLITEHGRIAGMKNEVGAKSYREITDKNLCNKFVVVRAEL
jgi:4-amino-4-deoxy-L-arabinose transferase-like glycosyltransferase